MTRNLAYLMSVLARKLNMDIVETCYVTYDFHTDLVVVIFIESKIELRYDTYELLNLQDSKEVNYFKDVVKEAYVIEYINRILK